MKLKKLTRYRFDFDIHSPIMYEVKNISPMYKQYCGYHDGPFFYGDVFAKTEERAIKYVNIKLSRKLNTNININKFFKLN